jgi:hypothetical protein
MDIDSASQHDAHFGYVPSNEIKNEFKEWAKMQSSKPHIMHAQDWFRTNCSVNDVSVDYCEQLINEAMNEALEAAAARAKVRLPSRPLLDDAILLSPTSIGKYGRITPSS